jgi:hypothetical protein
MKKMIRVLIGVLMLLSILPISLYIIGGKEGFLFGIAADGLVIFVSIAVILIATNLHYQLSCNPRAKGNR